MPLYTQLCVPYLEIGFVQTDVARPCAGHHHAMVSPTDLWASQQGTVLMQILLVGPRAN